MIFLVQVNIIVLLTVEMKPSGSLLEENHADYLADNMVVEVEHETNEHLGIDFED